MTDTTKVPPFGTPLNSSHPMARGLVLSLLLNETGGKVAVDGTGINYCPISGTTFKFNNSSGVFTSGGSDYINCGNKPAVNFTTACTISFEFKQATGLVSGVFKYGSASQQSYRLVVNSDNKIYWITSSTGSNANYAATTGTFPLGVWNRVVAVYDGAGAGNSTRLFIFLNGVEMGLAFSGTVSSSLFQSSANCTVNQYNGSTYGNGTFRGIMMWNRALSKSEARQMSVQPYSMYSKITNYFNSVAGRINNFFMFFR